MGSSAGGSSSQAAVWCRTTGRSAALLSQLVGQCLELALGFGIEIAQIETGCCRGVLTWRERAAWRGRWGGSMWNDAHLLQSICHWTLLGTFLAVQGGLGRKSAYRPTCRKT